ncbi:hypothetical protein AAY473_036366 [Plecturocebus cupreus]
MRRFRGGAATQSFKRTVKLCGSGNGPRGALHTETPNGLKGIHFHERVSPSPRLKYTGTIMTNCSLNLLGSKTRFYYVAQAGIKLLDSSIPPASTSQSAEISQIHSPPRESLIGSVFLGEVPHPALSLLHFLFLPLNIPSMIERCLLSGTSCLLHEACPDSPTRKAGSLFRTPTTFCPNSVGSHWDSPRARAKLKAPSPPPPVPDVEGVPHTPAPNAGPAVGLGGTPVLPGGAEMTLIIQELYNGDRLPLEVQQETETIIRKKVDKCDSERTEASVSDA